MDTQIIPTKEEQKIIEQVVADLLDQLDVEANFSLVENGEMLDVLLETKETGIIIGYHGEVLESLQLVLSLAIAKKLGRFVRIAIEVDGYRKNRTEYLEKLAMQVKEKALTENKEQVLMNLKSWERRIVHVFLQDDKEVISESSGEGRDRVLLIKPRN
ncbi:MAG TPA: KH domain-containing protein [Patescibacteria group bacterium]|nr:KH domain-containing protein [Patescibacteria group bacterium]